MKPSNPIIDFYNSPEWYRARAHALRAANYACSCCGKNVRGRGNARIDHIVPVKRDWNKRLDLSNLRVLCPACDNRRHSEKGRGGVEKEAIGLDGFPDSWR